MRYLSVLRATSQALAMRALTVKSTGTMLALVVRGQYIDLSIPLAVAATAPVGP